MLTSDDITKIGQELGKVIEDNVTPALDEIHVKLNRIESEMVTKDFLTEKMSDMKGDLVILMRKEDHKVVRLVEVLKAKQVLAPEEAREILGMEPFPQLVVS